jgi:hypothetical protein
MAIELWGQLLAREKELDSKEGVVDAREDGLGRARMECNTECIRAEAIR